MRFLQRTSPPIPVPTLVGALVLLSFLILWVYGLISPPRLDAYTGGTTTVTTAGTPVQLSSATTHVSILTITAAAANTGTIYVGGTAVLAATGNGVPLPANYSLAFNPQGNAAPYVLSEFWLDSTANGDKVQYAWK